MQEKILINEGDFGVKILFVCHGNICRSAAAEMIMKDLMAEEKRRDLEVASAASIPTNRSYFTPSAAVSLRARWGVQRTPRAKSARFIGG